MAAQGDHVDCARLILHAKANVNDVSVDYLTALHVAAHYGHVKTAKLLLDRNCDVNARALVSFFENIFWALLELSCEQLVSSCTPSSTIPTV